MTTRKMILGLEYVVCFLAICKIRRPGGDEKTMEGEGEQELSERI